MLGYLGSGTETSLLSHLLDRIETRKDRQWTKQIIS